MKHMTETIPRGYDILEDQVGPVHKVSIGYYREQCGCGMIGSTD